MHMASSSPLSAQHRHRPSPPLAVSDPCRVSPASAPCRRAVSSVCAKWFPSLGTQVRPHFSNSSIQSNRAKGSFLGVIQDPVVAPSCTIRKLSYSIAAARCLVCKSLLVYAAAVTSRHAASSAPGINCHLGDDDGCLSPAACLVLSAAGPPLFAPAPLARACD